MSDQELTFWYCVCDMGVIYTRKSYMSLNSWKRNDIIDRKNGLRYRDKHPEMPQLLELDLPRQLRGLVIKRAVKQGGMCEFTYGNVDGKIHAVAMVAAQDSFDAKIGRRIVENRLREAIKNKYERNFICYNEDE